MKTVSVKCCVCGGIDGELYSRGWDFEYGTTQEQFSFQACRECGHVYLNPRPAAEELPLIYPSEYYAYDMEKSVNSLALKTKHFIEKRKIRRLLRYCEAEEPRCLDIGCGDGRLLDAIASRGVPRDHLWGVELSESVVERLKARGYHGHFGRIEELDLPADSFDFILMFQVLEHVEDPPVILEAVSRLLAPGGIFVVETPNILSLDAKIFRRRYWGGYHFPRHWNLFHAPYICDQTPAWNVRKLDPLGQL